MLSRKQFLKEILTRGVRALMSFEEAAEETEPCQRPNCDASLTELSPSLVRMEAERMGADPADFGEAELRRQVYEAVLQQSGRRGSPPPHIE
jgi:hypothetical protein